MAHKIAIPDFRPHKEGFRQVLGDLEADIMEYIWAHGSSTVRAVHGHLNEERDLAYTTVMTVMTRLAEKELLVREQVGNAYAYLPAVSRDAFAEQVVAEVLDALMGNFGDQTVSHFARQIEQADEGRLAKLQEAVQRKRGR